MTPERYRGKRPYEVFDINEDELTRWRISGEKLTKILANTNTTINSLEISENTYGEFLFLTASRGRGDHRICMSFYGLGYHQFRERWLHDEWFWRQTPNDFVPAHISIAKDEATTQITERLADISPHLEKDTQTEIGKTFEALADLADEDAALAEMQDLGLL